jgi:hypothetical protein
MRKADNGLPQPDQIVGALAGKAEIVVYTLFTSQVSPCA